MRVVMSALLCGLGIVAAYYLYLRLPIVRDYRDCYNQAYSIYNEREKGIIIRKFNLGEEAICLESKAIILKSLVCIQATDKKANASETEQKILKKAAQAALGGPRDVTEMVLEHNQKCPGAKTVVRFDPRTDTWF